VIVSLFFVSFPLKTKKDVMLRLTLENTLMWLLVLLPSNIAEHYQKQLYNVVSSPRTEGNRNFSYNSWHATPLQGFIKHSSSNLQEIHNVQVENTW
jgi:hypothetical protein